MKQNKVFTLSHIKDSNTINSGQREKYNIMRNELIPILNKLFLIICITYRSI